MAGADSRPGGSVAVGAFVGDAGLTLTAGSTGFTVLPEVGLLGASLRHDGREFLDLHGGADAARNSHTTGLPLLAPWANRLGGDRYEVAGTEVDLRRAPALHRDANGLPMHGTLVGRRGWELTSIRSRGESAAAVARFRAGADPEVMASFPFPHDLTVTFTVTPGQLTVATLLEATGSAPVPVSFGWHPYFCLPGVTRERLRLELPDRKHLMVDERQIPTGKKVSEPAETVVLAGRTFDDGYRLGRDRRFGLVGGGRRLDVAFERGFPYAQVYAPDDHDYVALEPMTAPTDALCRDAAPVVEPGGRYNARFRVTLS
ncbi:MAG TPA: aldose 1-epimerase [Acidimicrobiales bacterium]